MTIVSDFQGETPDPANMRAGIFAELEYTASLAQWGDVRNRINDIRERARDLDLSPQENKNLVARSEEILSLGIHKKWIEVDSMLNTNPEFLEKNSLKSLDQQFFQDLKKYPDLAENHSGMPAKLSAALAQQTELAKQRKKTCGQDTDLSGRFPPRRDQTDIGWCYAFTAADLLSYYTGHDASPADIAILTNAAEDALSKSEKREYNPGSNSGILEAGYVEKSLQLVLNRGYCLEKDFPSELMRSKSGNQRRPYRQALQEIEVFKRATDQFPEIREPYCSYLFERMAKKIFPNVKLEDFKKIFEKSEQKSLINALGQASCHGQRQDFSQDREIQAVDSDCSDLGKTMRHLVTSIDSKDPVVVYINDELLSPEGYKGQSTMNNHVVVVAGKRWNEKTRHCEFRIRNSSDHGRPDQWISEGNLLPSITKSTSLPLKNRE